MDPVGPWYASYNRLASGTSSSSFLNGGANTGDFISHQTVPSTTSSPLLLQTTQATASLTNQPTSFNPGGFISSPSVSYDVFSPLFHHANAKQAHYTSEQRQVLSQNPAQTKSVTPSEPEAGNLRENYVGSHQPGETNFFEQQAQGIPPNPSNLAWSQPVNSQLPSPFGILPHESVVPLSPGTPNTKPAPTTTAAVYEGHFNASFNSGQGMDSMNNPQDSIISNFPGGKKMISPGSPPVIKSGVCTSPVVAEQAFFQQVSTTFGSENLGRNYQSGNENSQVSGAKVPVVLEHQQQSCIVSNQNCRIPQTPRSIPTTIAYPPSAQEQDKNSRNFAVSSCVKSSTNVQQPVQTKAQAKVYPDHETSQSSPISFSMMDARNLNYTQNTNNNGTGKIQNNQRAPSNPNIQPQHQQFHVINQQTQPSGQQPSYRHYPTNSQSDSEYHHSRSKSVASTDSAYSSTTSTQNGGDCGVVVPRRPSPLQAHSQASPLGHVPSPAYPMYNSPMASMSSPSALQLDNNATQCASAQTYKAQQQVTPPSPLDVTVSRPVPQNQIAYPSVITRADPTSFTQKQSICWENENGQNRKFPQPYGTNDEINSQMIRGQQQVQSTLNMPDRQPSYFDSNQVPLQDLSSCRGDPMDTAKILPTGNCQIQQQSITTLPAAIENPKQVGGRHRKIDANKKRRSFDKGQPQSSSSVSPLDELTPAAPMSDYSNRIPPPAHHNSNQQAQNGYYDFERWNLSPQTAKIYPATSAAFGTQPTLHHPSNFVGNTTHQHQGLMAPHHHTSPSIPYFPTFHLPSTHPGPHSQDFQSNIDSSAIGFGESALDQQNPGYQDYRDDQPKVIVPNIEEELGFLQQNELIAQQANNRMNRELKQSSKDPNSGFMTSYLKFLQGEREPSPPPAVRGGRKASWNRSKSYAPQDMNRSCEMSTNGQIDVTKSQNSMKEVPTIDYANDPRYFPLPKERKKPYIDSSDDGIDSGDDFPFSVKKADKKINNNMAPSFEKKSVAKSGRPAKKKGRPIKPGGPTDKKRKAAAAAAALTPTKGPSVVSSRKTEPAIPIPTLISTPIPTPTPTTTLTLTRTRTPTPTPTATPTPASAPTPAPTPSPTLIPIPTPISIPIPTPSPPPPRRETSKRKAKEKISSKQLQDQQSDDDEQGDSDTDPAWTPAAKLVGDEDEKKKKRGRLVSNKRARRLLEDDDNSFGEATVTKRGKRKKDARNSMALSCKIDEKLLASISDEDIDISPFKSGEFVVIKSELSEEFPPLWRIDGKTLLQKYEPFTSEGRTLYRNISTYSGWASQNRHIYQQVPVKFWQQGKLETIVEFLRDEMILDDSEYMDLSIKENEKYQDNFEVYIQTLISQALDSNFLTEIFQEKDDYFLSNVETVDEITEERKRRLLSTTKWQQNVILAFSTWPCLNILKGLSASESKGKECSGCQHTEIFARILLYGQPYNATTLEGSPPDPRVSEEKDFLLCRVCQTKIGLFNKVAHQKYLMFLECARRVAEKRMADPNKDTTIILNELLADEAWLNQLFKDVRTIWAEIDSIEHQARKKENSKFTTNNCESNPIAPDVLMRTDSQLPIEESMNDSLSTTLS